MTDLTNGRILQWHPLVKSEESDWQLSSVKFSGFHPLHERFPFGFREKKRWQGEILGVSDGNKAVFDCDFNAAARRIRAT